MKQPRESHTIADIEGTREGEDDDLETIHNDDWRDAVDVGELRVFEGDLTVHGDFDSSNGAMLVKGNLSVTGVLGLDETGSLIVTGNLHCCNLSCEGNLEIQGDVIVDEAIFGYYEAGITFFDGKVRAKLFLEGNHAFEYQPDHLDVGTHIGFDNHQGLNRGTKEEAESILSDDALKALGRLMGLTEKDPEKTVGDVLYATGLLR